jgi:formate hydrogenlyase subunit 3/multisubunit Na+/H+ antiporter MnhD subunit
MLSLSKLTTVLYFYLPLWLVALPMLGALVVYLLGDVRERLRDIVVVAIAAVTFVLVLAMYPSVVLQRTALEFTLPLLGEGLRFLVDPLGLLFATITSLVWLAATIFSLSYMYHEHKRRRFYIFLLLTLAANLGLVIAGDLFSLFVFFEGLGFLAYPLIIHTETEEALRAGTKYLFMTIFGGLSLLFGILLLYSYSGSTAISPALGALREAGFIKYVISGLMILGFGVKAGMIPVHIWLPDAHPAAPSPASALLSGVMIKAGAYGIIRTLGSIFRPPFEAHEVARIASSAKEAVVGGHTELLWETTKVLGYAVIWIGIVTMFLGVLMALLQENSKRMLAYHSISQMGYILMGIGVAGYLGHEGAIGLAGGVYHIINHALFKAALFLGVGAVYFRTGELNMYKLGGLRRKMPLVAAFTFIAALGISGIPLFNGFVSKTLLHHAIVEAHGLTASGWLKVAEIIFIITGGGTLCSFIKLTTFTFMGKMPERYEKVKEVPLAMNLSMLLLSSIIILFGVFPNFFLRTFMIPALEYWHYPALSLEHLANFHLWELRNFIDLMPSLLAGVLIFVVGVRFGLFHLHFPKWFGVDYWYYRAAMGFLSLARGVAGLNRLAGQAVAQVITAGFGLYRWIEVEWKTRYHELLLSIVLGIDKAREREMVWRIEKVLREEALPEAQQIAVREILTEMTLALVEGKGDRTEIIREADNKLKEILSKYKRNRIFEKYQVEYRKVRDLYRSVEGTFAQKTSDWLRAMAHLALEVLFIERVPWMIEQYYTEEEIVGTRNAIRAYTRDMSVNVLVIVGMLLLLAVILRFNH